MLCFKEGINIKHVKLTNKMFSKVLVRNVELTSMNVIFDTRFYGHMPFLIKTF